MAGKRSGTCFGSGRMMIKKIYVALIVFCFLLLLCVQAIDITKATQETIPNSDNRNGSVASTSEIGRLTLTVSTDYDQYADEFQTVGVTAKVGKQDGPATLVLEARDSSGKLVANQSRPLWDWDAAYFVLYPGEIGVHNITVKAFQNGNVVESYTTYNVISFWTTNTSFFLFAALASFAGLLISIGASKSDDAKTEILRFVFLSGIVVSILGALFFIQSPYGTASPIGLVALNQTQPIFSLSEAVWAFKVGGQLYVPLYVIVFGLIGGYIRYLYKTSRLLTDTERRMEIEEIRKYLVRQNNDHNIDKKIIFFESLRDVTLFFLAPILATVAWFLFSQWEPSESSIYLLAVISFASGLITTEIINAISQFARNNLSRSHSSDGAKNSNGAE